MRLCVAGLLLALLLTGCGSSQEAVRPVPVERDLRNWALPTDPYDMPSEGLLAYASDLIRADCLEKAGIANYPIIPYNENAPQLPTLNSAGRRLFNTEIARRFGYRVGHSQRISERLLQQRQEPNVPGYAEAADRCEKQVVAAGIDWSQLSDHTIQKLILTIKPDGESKTEINSAKSKWRTCMAAHPVPGQPDDPEKMPGDVLTRKFALDKDPEWNSPPATSEEIAVAVQDAKCRESSGYSQALYDAEYEAQAKVVKEHASELAPLLERNKKVLEAARRIIKERG